MISYPWSSIVLSEPSTKPYSGPYQDKLMLGPEEIEAITESEGMALSEMLTTLRALSANVGALTSELKNLKWSLPLMITIGFTIISLVLALKK